MEKFVPVLPLRPVRTSLLSPQYLTCYAAPSSPSATDLFSVTTHTTVPWTPEQEPLLKRLGWRQRVKEFFRPDLRKKRALEEFEISQRLDVSTEEPVEAPRLPGLGLEKLNRIEEMDMVGVVDGEQNDGVSSAHKLEEEVTALPEIPGHHEAVP